MEEENGEGEEGGGGGVGGGVGGGGTHLHTCELLDLRKSKQGNTTNLNISFSMENEKRAAQVGFKPTTYMYCLRGRCSTN